MEGWSTGDVLEEGAEAGVAGAAHAPNLAAHEKKGLGRLLVIGCDFGR